MAVGVGVGMIEIFVILFTYSGLGIPFGVPPAAEDPMMFKVAPEECWYYTTWAGMAVPDPASPNHTEQLLAEPEVRTLVKEIRKQIYKGFKKMEGGASPQEQLAAELLPRWVPYMITRPTTIFISDFQMDETGPKSIDAAIVVNLGEKVQQAKAAIKRLETQQLKGAFNEVDVKGSKFHAIKPGPTAPLISWGFKDDYLILAAGEKTVDGIFERFETPTPDWLATLKQQKGIDRISTVTYVDIQQFVNVADKFAPPPTGMILKALDIEHALSYASVSGLDATSFASHSTLRTDGTVPQILAPMLDQEFTASDLSTIPSDSNVAAAFSLNVDKLLTIANEIGDQFDPGFSANLDATFAQISQFVGFSLRDELIKSLGSTWMVYNSPSEGGILLTGLTATLEVKDYPKLKKSLDKVIEVAVSSMPANGTLRLIQSEYAGKTVTTVTFDDDGFPFAPTWCLTETHLVASLNPQNVRAMLIRDKNFESIAGNSDIKKMIAGRQLSSLAYIDTKQFAQLVYPFLPYVLQTFSQEMSRSGIDFDPSVLPSLAVLSRHVQPSISTISRVGNNINFTAKQTLPGNNAALLAPTFVGFSLPAINAARQAALRNQGINQLRQIGLACVNYESAYGHFPAASLKTKDGKPGLSWRVAILPFIEENGLYEQFNLDEPWDSPNNKPLAARMPQVFRSPRANVAPDKTVYLAIRGKDCVIAEQEKGVVLRQIKDGTSKTIMAVEANNEAAVTWTKPDDFEWDKNNPVKGLGDLHAGNVFLAVFCDCAVLAVSKHVDGDVLQGFFTKSGGERGNLFDFDVNARAVPVQAIQQDAIDVEIDVEIAP